MREIKLGSLFDGSAGFPLAAISYGIKAVWASEIEPYPIRVTTKRIPFMKHYGDISEINGAEIEPVDIITGGSPCQDMSIAGKRAGLDGERSGLFREQIRIVKEMRDSTNGRYPRFMVWENVPGALSSNKGQDFRCVLEEIARVKATGFNVPMPDKGKWGKAGTIVDKESNFSIGWRILDAQYWGVPQRRRRIFLVADFSATSSEKILFKREGLSWHFAKSREAWQTASGEIAKCFNEAGEYPIYSIDREAISSGYEFDRKPGIDETGTAYTLKATGPGGVAYPTIFEMTHADEVIRQHNGGVCPTLQARMGTGGNQVPMTMQIRCGCEGGGKGALIQENKSATLSTHNNQTLFCMATQQGGAEIGENICPTITAAAGMSGNNQPVLCLSRTHGISVSENVVPTIQAAAGESGNNQPMICEPIQVVDQGGGKSQCNVTENLSPTLTCTHQGEPVICEPIPIQDQAISNGNGNGSGISEPDEPMYTLMADTHHGVAYSLQGNMIGRSDKNGPQGSGVNEEVNFTLNATDQHAVVYSIDRESYNCGENFARNLGISDDGINATLKASGPDAVGVPTYCSSKASFFTLAETELANTLVATDYKDPPIINDNNGFDYIVRRLMPLECARLQGFPDWWTANLGTKEEDITEEMMTFWREVFETHRKLVTGASKPKTDKQIKKWLVDPNNDSAEYKMWGNGVALPCVLYVMEGIAEVLNEDDES